MPFRDKSPVAGKSGELWPKLTLTPAQQKLWDETRTATLWSQPSFADIWYAMMVDRDGQTAWFTDHIPIAATDDKFMYINPATFFSYTIEQRVFACLHEILHCTFNHCGLFWHCRLDGQIRYPDGLVLPYVEELMQIAADCVINAILVEGQCGERHPSWWYMPKVINGAMSVLDAYRVLYKQCKRMGGGQGMSKPNNSGLTSEGQSFDEHLTPGQGRGKTPTEAESERSPQQWINAVNAAMHSAKLAGRLPLNLERLFCANMEVPTDWTELVATTLGKHIGREGHTWLYLDNEMALRGIGFPSRVDHGCDHVVVVGDSSGSVNQKTMDMFMSNCAAILQQAKPKRLTFVQCDATIHSWQDIDDVDDLNGKVLGGGGTDFRPPFERIEELGDAPDVLVYLTDLYGPFPDKPPPYPVIWGCVNKQKAPWGETIYIPAQADDEELASY
jgi:hypothetical protein